MTINCVQQWFGDSFKDLHPLLQKLHIDGGVLFGTVNVTVGNGLAGYIGRRLLRKLGVSNVGSNTLEVVVQHYDQGFLWNRSFNQHAKVTSQFDAVGTRTSGYWLETLGSISVFLTVDIHEGAWHWRCKKMSYKNVTLPKFLLPKANAYKLIENNRYRFYVGITLPLLGECFSYSGLLDMVDH
jgi:hypothetical protein